MITLSAIWIYPIKSLQGIALQASAFGRRGLDYDRRWMLVDTQGQFLSQREIPAMAQLKVAISEPQQQLQIIDTQGETLNLPLPPYLGPEQGVRVWNSQTFGQAVSDEADRWFSQRLGHNCHLVYQPERVVRPTSANWAPGYEVSFADGYPFLIATEASLAALAKKVGSLDMRAFRPNLVLAGSEAWSENTWQGFEMGALRFRFVKPCVRCVIITLDPETGASQNPRLLKELNQEQSWQGGPIFGQNAIAETNTGSIKIGDTVTPTL
jgi:uncharacterized protein